MRLVTMTAVALALAGAGLSASAEPLKVRPVGRVMVEKTGRIEANWSGSGFEASFQGSRLQATIEDSGDNFLSVEVDGRIAVLDLEPGRYAYTLFEGETGSHSIRVVRRTSPLAGSTKISNIVSDGPITPTEAPARRMLIIGDSIATGFGVDGPNAECQFSYATQNHTRTFGAVAAKDFNADLHTIAVDGRGLIHNWASDPAPTMRELAPRTLPGSTAVWDVSRYQPDVIVIHLGTNDFFGHDPQPGFSLAYDSLLKELRNTYPKALIVGGIGPSLYGAERAAAANAIRGSVEARNKSGDKMVHFIEFNVDDSPRAWGCSHHPGIDAQARMARDLSGLIKSQLGW